MSVKKTVGKLIPYPVIENGRRIIHAGPLRCEVCGNRVRKWLDSGYGFPVLEKLRVVGGLMRRADRCPICHATSRERLVTFWLGNAGKGFRFKNGVRVAHFAPEKGLTKVLTRHVSSGYRTFDFDPSRYRHIRGVERADLANLDAADGSFDLLICNHVLEHVPDVGVALGEIRRVLADDGMAVLQVPIALDLDEHIELGQYSSSQERIERVGQDDHLRLFTRDSYVAALSEAGFEVELFDAFASDASAATDWRLDPFETLFLVRKANSS